MTETAPFTSAGTSSREAPADAVLDALDLLLGVARENIVAWVGVMERVEQIREQRIGGVPYSAMEVHSSTPPIIDTVSRAQERLTQAAAQFRRALARELASEGMSYSDIARVFGVTRQRVGNLMRGDESPPA